MNRSDLDTLLEISRRRRLTAAEAARIRQALAGDPTQLADWAADSALTRLLGELPAPAVPTNFTARVLEQLDRETPAAAPRSLASGWMAWLRLWPRWAAAALFLALTPLAYRHHQAWTRTQLATSLAQVGRPLHQAGQTTPLPLVEVLRDFEAIDSLRRATTTAAADMELLASLESSEPR